LTTTEKDRVENSLWGFDDGKFTEGINLLRFIESFEGSTVYMSSKEGSFDVKRCGRENEPCKTFGFGVTQLTKEDRREIKIEGEVEQNITYELTNDEIKKKENINESEKSKLILKSDMNGGSNEYAVYKVSGNGKFEKITFSIETGFTDKNIKSVIKSEGENSKCEIVNCGFEFGTNMNEIGTTLINGVSGILNVSGCEITNKKTFKFKAVGVKIENGIKEGILNGMKFNKCEIGIDNSSLIEIDGSGMSSVDGVKRNITISSSVFEEIIHSSDTTGGNKGCLFIGGSVECKVDNCTFRNCSDEKCEQGGGIGVELGSTGNLEIANSSFVSCKAENTNKGHGGGIYIDCTNGNLMMKNEEEEEMLPLKLNCIFWNE